MQEMRREEQSLRTSEPRKGRLGLSFYHFPANVIWGKSLSTVKSVLLIFAGNDLASGGKLQYSVAVPLTSTRNDATRMLTGSHRPVTGEAPWQQTQTCLVSHCIFWAQYNAQHTIGVHISFAERVSQMHSWHLSILKPRSVSITASRRFPTGHVEGCSKSVGKPTSWFPHLLA